MVIDVNAPRSGACLKAPASTLHELSKSVKIISPLPIDIRFIFAIF